MANQGIRAITGTGRSDTIMSLPSDEPVVIYVNGTIGSDSYDGSSPTVDGGGVGPKATYAGAKALVPFIRRKDYMIKMAAGTYSEQCVIDGIGNTIAVAGDYAVEQTGTIDHVDDGTNPGPLNPGGLYQMQINWAGGFTLTDLVDDEKWLLVEFADGTYQTISLLAVLAADTAEVALRFAMPAGKGIGDYANQPVSLVSPSVVFDPPGGNGALQISGLAGLSQREDNRAWTGVVLFGLEFTGDNVAEIQRYHGYLMTPFVRFDSTGQCIDYEQSNVWMAMSVLDNVWASTASKDVFYALIDDLLGNGSPACGLVAIANGGAGGGDNSLGLGNTNVLWLSITGVFKGEIQGAIVSALQLWNIMIYNATAQCIRVGRGEGVLGVDCYGAVLRKGGLSVYEGGIFRGVAGVLEMREVDNEIPLQATSGAKLETYSSFSFNVDNNNPSEVMHVEDARVYMESDLVVSGHTVGQPGITMVDAELIASGDLTFPDQDYGDATAGGGIIVADQKSHVRLTGDVTGSNTNGANDEPLVLRRGSEADLGAGYALQDGAAAATAIVGSAGSVGVPAAGNTVNDIGGAGNEEMCRISRL